VWTLWTFSARSQSVDTLVENGGFESNQGKKVAKGYVGEEKGSSGDVVR
jgi:hypothetical protein